MSFTTRHSVLRGIKNDQNDSWNRFFDIYAPLIRLHGKDCGIGDDSLDDLVQDVMLSVLINTRTFEYDPAKGRFRDYLRFIIRARSNDMLRVRYKQEKALEIDISEEYLDDLYKTEWEEHLRTVSLKKLKESVSIKHYQIFHMLDIQNRKIKDVAKFFKMSEASVYSIRNRTELKLREIAEELDR